jgi:hypothetical protein
MAEAIAQINVPGVIQSIIHSYVFYSEAETLQRNYKRTLLNNLRQCERLSFTDDLFTSFLYKQLIRNSVFPYKNHTYFAFEYKIFHAGFCNDCNNYIYASGAIPTVIECTCAPILIPDVD